MTSLVIKSYKNLFKNRPLMKKVKFLKPKEWADEQGEDQDQQENQQK